MSDPPVEWYLEQVQRLLKEIDSLVVNERHITNAMREIISYNTNEIEIKVHTIIRKLSDASQPRQNQVTHQISEQ